MCALPLQLEAAEFMAVCDCPEYLSKVERRLGEETDRVAQYLDPSTEPKITRVVEKELIQAQVGTRVYARPGFMSERNTGRVPGCGTDWSPRKRALY